MSGEQTPPTWDYDPSRWDRVQELFIEASELEAAERRAFLEEACAGDEQLLSQVLDLLQGADGATHLIDHAVAKGLAAVEDEETALPEKIGVYRVLGLLGRGGMGAVYLAERDDEHYRQQVAIKVVSHQLAAPHQLNRLRQERQILAHLQHPHIARLLDGGNTEGGAPFFVMEHIKGVPIDVFCEENQLGVDDRLRLFLKVCEAVQYAHQSLVIHRDLKPSNLLVTEEGEPKLLDFGIAKLLDSDLSDPQAHVTMTGLRPMTPLYASPEQFQGLPLTTSTDVYSLGVVLFQLLTGRRPFEKPHLELEAAVLHEQAPKPSSVDLPAGDAMAEGPSRLRKRLVGDLDNVISNALRKEPERRYASAEALADDLRRHLNGLPVSARPPSFGYVAGKLVARHRRVLAVGLAALLALVSLAAFYTVQLSQERDAADLEAQKRATVAGFLADLFGAAHPNVDKGREQTVRELLDEGALRLGSELQEVPEVRAELQDVIGRAYLGQGDLASARPHFEAAYENRRQRLPPTHLEIAVSLRNLGEVATAEGDYDQALAFFEQALDIRRKAGSEPEIAESLFDLATSLFYLQRYDDAERGYRECLEIRRRALGEQSPETADTLAALAVNLQFQNRMEEAEVALRQGVAQIRRQYGDEHLEVVRNLNNLGHFLLDKGDPEEAESWFRRSLEIDRRMRPDSHADRISFLQNLATALARQGKSTEARKVLNELLRDDLDLHGPISRQRALALLLFGELESGDGGGADAAEERYRQALAVAEQLTDGFNPEMKALRALAKLAAESHPDQAQHWLRRGLERAEAQGDALWLAEYQVRLGELLSHTGQTAGADPLLRSGYASILQMEGGDGPFTPWARERLCDHFRRIAAADDLQATCSSPNS